MAKVGDYNMTSDRSGFVYPRSEMRQEWTGRWVHYSEWEPQQPQEIITPKKDNQRVWPVRDEQAVVNVVIDSSSQILYTTATRLISVSNSGRTITATENITGPNLQTAVSDPIVQTSQLKGVRFSVDMSKLADQDIIYVGYVDSTSLQDATKALLATLQYDIATNNLIVVDLGNVINGDAASYPAVIHTYTSNDQICVAIDSTGLIELRIGGETYSFLTSLPSVDGLRYFLSMFVYSSSGAEITLATGANNFTGVTDFTMSTVPVIPPSQLDSY